MTAEERLRLYAGRVNMQPEDVVYALALMREAVLAEREACAEIAGGAGETVRTGPGGDCAQGCQGVAEEITDAIRARAAP